MSIVVNTSIIVINKCIISTFLKLFVIFVVAMYFIVFGMIKRASRRDRPV